MPLPVKRILKLGLVFLLTLGFILTTAYPHQAQFSLPEDLGQPRGDRPPDDVTRYGSIEVAQVRSAPRWQGAV